MTDPQDSQLSVKQLLGSHHDYPKVITLIPSMLKELDVYLRTLKTVPFPSNSSATTPILSSSFRVFSSPLDLTIFRQNLSHGSSWPWLHLCIAPSFICFEKYFYNINLIIKLTWLYSEMSWAINQPLSFVVKSIKSVLRQQQTSYSFYGQVQQTTMYLFWDCINIYFH